MEKGNSRGSISPLSSVHRSKISNDASSHSKVDAMRVVRLILESLETAFFLANIYLERYGLAKIFDMINQILPTAYVYNTGYWVFYNNQYRQNICVCNRFGIRCPHMRSDLHFVNMNPLIETAQNHYLTPFRGKLYPVVANIKVAPILSDVLRAYDAKITVTVQPLRFQNKQFEIYGNEKASFSMETRYILTPEHCPLQNSVVQFNPSPMGHYAYTSYFQTMKRFQVFPTAIGFETQIPRTYTIVSADLPRFGIIPNDGPAGQPLPNRNAANLQYGNNLVFPGGFSNIWTCSDDNSCNIRLRGGSVTHATLSSITFCEQRLGWRSGPIRTSNQKARNETSNAAPRRVHISPRLNVYQNPRSESSGSSPSYNSDDMIVPRQEQNFRGPDYENSFPSLPQGRGAGKNSSAVAIKEEVAETAQLTDGEASATIAVKVEEQTYASRVASMSFISGQAKKKHGNEKNEVGLLRIAPAANQRAIRKKLECIEVEQNAKNNKDWYVNLPSSSTSSDVHPRAFSKRTL